MALNRGLYNTLGTNLVQSGRMVQKWLISSASQYKINTTTDQYGRPGDPTVGRGLVLKETAGDVFSVAGAFTAELQPGNSVVDIVRATATFSRSNASPATIAVPTQIRQNSVGFQTVILDVPPTYGPPYTSGNGTVGALAAISGPFCGTDGTLTTLAGVPLTATSSLSVQQVPGLTATLTFGAAASSSAPFTVGRGYTITTVGTTDFTLIGAPSNTIGTSFVATGVGTGTGTAITQQVTGVALSTPTPNVLALLASYANDGQAVTWTLQLPKDCGGNLGVVCNPVAALATTLITAPDPSWVTVELEFTNSTAKA